jgi:hypothetical protein
MEETGSTGSVPSPTPPTAVVEVRSGWASKINWTQVVAAAAAVATVFGLNLSPENQAHIVAAISVAQALATIVLKTYYTSTITPSAAARAEAPSPPPPT